MRKLLALFALFFASNAFAQDLNQEQTERYNNLGREIRCVVCQSEPIGTSSAKIAIDMRDIVREQILKGQNDAQIRDYFATHYGEYVLLRPQISKATYLLWFAPLLLLALGAFVAIRSFGNKSTEVDLTDEELKQAEAIAKEYE